MNSSGRLLIEEGLKRRTLDGGGIVVGKGVEKPE